MQDESRNDLLEIGVTEIGFADALYAVEGSPDSCSSCASCWSLCCCTI